MLILAGVTLNLALGERGIFRIANDAAKNYTEAQEKELAELEKLDNLDWLNKENEIKPIYARLYTDGTLILSGSNYVDASREIQEDYGDISKNEYYVVFNENELRIEEYALPEWISYETHTSKATNIIIYDTIQPTTMCGWFMYSPMSSIDLKNIDTSKLTDTSYTFSAMSLTNLDLSNFKTDNVTNMTGMFCESYGLTNLNLSNFKTNNVTNMFGMFVACTNLTNLDLSNFKTNNVTNMSMMFVACARLTEIYVNKDNWIVPENSTKMFDGCGTSEVTPI